MTQQLAAAEINGRPAPKYRRHKRNRAADHSRVSEYQIVADTPAVSPKLQHELLKPHNSIRSKIAAKTEFTPEAWVRANAARIVRFLVPFEGTPPQLEIETVRRSEGQITFLFSVGARKAVVKAFDPSRKDARARCEREVACARILNGTGLVPQAIGHSEDTSHIIFEHISGQSLSEAMTRFNVQDIARAMGDWYGALHSSVPQKDSPTTWFDYLGKYGEFREVIKEPQIRHTLKEMPIASVALCRNDAHLSNFILGDDDRLVGFDFEAAAMKPEGWDILLAARYLGRRFPQQIEAITWALVVGWGDGAGPVSQHRFLWLTRLFAETTIFESLGKPTDRQFQDAATVSSHPGQVARNPGRQTVSID